MPSLPGCKTERSPCVAASRTGDSRPERQRRGDLGVDVLEAKPKAKRPPRYLVIMLNDDYTPMNFVVEVLMRVFAMDEAHAVRTMLDVHTKGSAVCGTYTREIAETKCAQVIDIARSFEHPLMCRIEPALNDDK